MLPIRTILHPTDFSECSAYAFRLACSLARDYAARLVVLHVYLPPLNHSEVVARRQPDGYEEDLWNRLRGLQPADPKVAVEHQLVEGNPAQEILRLVSEVGCDVIVMGTHGHTGLGRLVMGSVAEQVVRKAPCPVLTVKMPQRQPPPSEEPVPATAGREEKRAALEEQPARKAGERLR